MRHCSILPGLGGLGGLGCLLSSGTSGRASLAAEARTNEAITGLTIAEDGWAGLFDIVTAPSARRRGLGRRMVDGLLHGAWELGAHHAYLQVGADNLAARRLYAHYGFTERYRYWYRGHSD